MLDMLTTTGSLFLNYKANLAMQADDDDDSFFSSLTLRLRYSKHTQNAAFFLNMVAEKRKMTN